MRASLAIYALLLGACAASAPSSVPVEVVGDGEHGVLRQHAVVPTRAFPVCMRATDDDEWSAVEQELGAGVLPAAIAGRDFAIEQIVAVPLSGEVQLLGIVVSSEEGVDVLTLDVGRAQPRGPRACLLHLGRRTCQVAIILRDQERGMERTLAVYPGL